jgi:hypothetical protein
MRGFTSKRDHYSHEINSRFTTCCATPGDGTYYLTQDGTADKPIAIVAAGDGEVIFDGDGNTVLFNLMGGDYQYFEGITFRNTGIVIEAGQKNIAGSKGLTVKRSRFVDVGTAVHSDWSGPRGLLRITTCSGEASLRVYLVRNQALDRFPGLCRAREDEVLLRDFGIWPGACVRPQPNPRIPRRHRSCHLRDAGQLAGHAA